MNDNQDTENDRSKAVARAVASLVTKQGFSPDLVFEGAIRGAASQLLATGSTVEQVAVMLEQSARHIRRAGQSLTGDLA
jgi:hypothetical protein